MTGAKGGALAFLLAAGAAVRGGLHRDRLQFNEKTLWSGGPGAAEGYDFGLPMTPVTDVVSEVWGTAAASAARVRSKP